MTPKTITASARLRLVQVYYLHAAYLTPLRLHQARLSPDATCPRCSQQQADFYHMVWCCSVIAHFWEKVVGEITEVLGWEVPLAPLNILLGVTDGLDGSRADKLFLNTALTVAKRDIAANWLNPTALTITRWRRGVDWCVAQEKPLYEARGCSRKYCKIWGRWVGVIEDWFLHWTYRGLITCATLLNYFLF